MDSEHSAVEAQFPDGLTAALLLKAARSMNGGGLRATWYFITRPERNNDTLVIYRDLRWAWCQGRSREETQAAVLEQPKWIDIVTDGNYSL